MTDQDRQLVEREWDNICPMEPLYADNEWLEPLHEQALQVLNNQYGPTESEPNVREWIAYESARRTAAALALLCYGGRWDSEHGPEAVIT